jgi:hypothetical protein
MINRNIREKPDISDEIKKIMYSIPILNNQNDVIVAFNKINASGNKSAIGKIIYQNLKSISFICINKFFIVLDWAKDKKIPWVLSAISFPFSRIPSDVWYGTPSNTNASESAHAAINRTGSGVSLLAAIK